MQNSAVRIQDCIDNHDKYIAVMAALPDKELAKKLDLVHIQMELAEQTKNTDSLELLEVWHLQIIEARIYKAENNISDAPNEIELAIADIETFIAKAEERTEIINEYNNAPKHHRTKAEEQNNDNQLSLF
ncbi:MAG TPA: hypothetical protein VNG53_00715 [Bacteroidia bacterium]|nr:hypothetical protein [Bacteroidia bacterium]